MATSKKTKKAAAEASTRKEVEKAEKEILAELEELLATENTTLDTLYIINDSTDPVTLEVAVEGEGQTSDMTVKLGSDLIVSEHAGNLPEKRLGTNKELIGKKLSLVAVITDTSKVTNFTGLKIRLNGGVIPTEFPLFKTVDEEGQSADYLCLIEFFKP